MRGPIGTSSFSTRLPPAIPPFGVAACHRGGWDGALCGIGLGQGAPANWLAALAGDLIRHWLSDHRQYRLALAGPVANPERRIT